jgi:hypothetical protein
MIRDLVLVKIADYSVKLTCGERGRAEKGNSLAVIETKKCRRTREQSSISFPYVDLNAAVDVARAIFDLCGTAPCDINSLATDLNDSMGGAFRLKTSAARIFDLVEKRGRSELQLTDAGVAIVEKNSDALVKADAFLRVPLYAAVYQKFRDRKLPHRPLLEDEMKELGVPPKQVDKARQVFERSARQAGLLDVSDNRLIHPRVSQPQIGNNSRIAPAAMLDVDGRYASLAAAEPVFRSRLKATDPLIVGLVEHLPAAGSAWSLADRVAWLRLASSIFDVSYTAGGGEIEIRVGASAEPLDTLPDEG